MVISRSVAHPPNLRRRAVRNGGSSCSANAIEPAVCRARWAPLPDLEDRPVEVQRDSLASIFTAAQLLSAGKKLALALAAATRISSGKLMGLTLSPPERSESGSRAKRLDVVDVGTIISKVLA